MRFLVFDTETTGLPKTKYIGPSILHLWPYILQFSYIIYDSHLNDIVTSRDHIVKLAENICIPDDSTKIHGITKKISLEKGENIYNIIDDFINHLQSADMIVGHNIEFDINMVKVELLRLINGNEHVLSKEQLKKCKYDLYCIANYKSISCTQKESTDFCNIQVVNKNGKPYLKYPKLIELHEKLFQTKPSNLHNSFNDILVTLRCFMQLKHNIDLNENCLAFKQHSHEIGIA